jgi:hypothetical protein
MVLKGYRNTVSAWSAPKASLSHIHLDFGYGDDLTTSSRETVILVGDPAAKLPSL